MKNNKRIEKIKTEIEKIKKQTLIFSNGDLDKLSKDVRGLHMAIYNIKYLCDAESTLMHETKVEEQAKALMDAGHDFHEIIIDGIQFTLDGDGQLKKNRNYYSVPF